MICDKHREFDCPVCFPRNPAWSASPSDSHSVLTPWEIKKYIRHIRTNAAVIAARRRIRGQD